MHKGYLREREEEEGEGYEARWLTTFNDLMTLLLVFFVLTFSMGKIDKKKVFHFSKGLHGGTGVLEAGQKMGIGVRKKITGLPVSSPPSTERYKIPNASDISIAEMASRNGINTDMTSEGVVIRLKDSILFDSGSASINSRAFAVLGRISSIIKSVDCPVRVEGHTDDMPIKTARFPSNWDLSVARAVNVLEYLIKYGGVSPKRLSVAGYGDSRPLVPNDSPSNRARNRRVDIVLITKEGGNNV